MLGNHKKTARQESGKTRYGLYTREYHIVWNTSKRQLRLSTFFVSEVLDFSSDSIVSFWCLRRQLVFSNFLASATLACFSETIVPFWRWTSSRNFSFSITEEASSGVVCDAEKIRK